MQSNNLATLGKIAVLHLGIGLMVMSIGSEYNANSVYTKLEMSKKESVIKSNASTEYTRLARQSYRTIKAQSLSVEDKNLSM